MSEAPLAGGDIGYRAVLRERYGHIRAARVAVRIWRAGRLRVRKLTGPVLWLPVLLAVRASRRQAGLILMYHDIADRDGDPILELVPPVSRARLGRQLAHLSRHYRMVELNDLQDAVATRRRGDAFPVALTFDDDLGHHASHALPELEKANAPATFFLCGSFLEGAPRDYWWSRLQRSVDRGTDLAALLGSGSIHEQGAAIQQLSPQQRDAISDELLRMAGPAPADEVLTAEAAQTLPHVGFHTVRHDPLTHVDDQQLGRALVAGRAELSELAGYPIDTIAYPHGNFDSRVVAQAREHQFTIGLTCRQEAVTPTSDPLVMGRYEAPCRGSTGAFAFDLVQTLLTSPTR